MRTSLSIVERELRVRARQRFTVWLRVGVGAVAMLMALAWFQATAESGNPAQSGRVVFSTLTWLCFSFCLFEGARQTADAISLEKREGTLGLLFLTDLSGLEVALGKLVAASLHSFYGLLAAFPVLGITLALGGITPGEFWRTQLALMNTLFLASTVGLAVSGRSADNLRAVLVALSAAFALALVPLAFDALVRAAGVTVRLTVPSLSPAAGVWFAGDAAYRFSPVRFWFTQAAQLGLAWGLLADAARQTSRAWHEAVVVPARRTRPGREAGWNYRVAPRLHAPPARALLEANPAGWLASRPRGLTPLVWLAIGLPTLGTVGTPLVFPLLGPNWVGASVVSVLQLGFSVMSVAVLALAAARPISEARRSGALELLLCTPVSIAEIVRGHWQALWRKVRLPLTLFLVLLPAGLLLWFGVAVGSRAGGLPWSYFLIGHAPQLVVAVMRLLAAGWVGLWLAVGARTSSQAVGRTLVLVMLVPWVLSTAILLLVRTWLSTSFTGPPPWWFWLSWSSASLVSVAWLIGLCLWAHRGLLTRFREGVGSGSAGHPGWRGWPRRSALRRAASG